MAVPGDEKNRGWRASRRVRKTGEVARCPKSKQSRANPHTVRVVKSLSRTSLTGARDKGLGAAPGLTGHITAFLWRQRICKKTFKAKGSIHVLKKDDFRKRSSEKKLGQKRDASGALGFLAKRGRTPRFSTSQGLGSPCGVRFPMVGPHRWERGVNPPPFQEDTHIMILLCMRIVCASFFLRPQAAHPTPFATLSSQSYLILAWLALCQSHPALFGYHTFPGN